MNILLISPSQGAYGGIEAFVLALADKIHSTNNNVIILFKKVDGFCLKDSLRKSIRSKTYVIKFISKLSIYEYCRYVNWAHLIHGHNPLIESVLSSLWRSKPCVFTIYNWCRLNLGLRPVAWRVLSKCVLNCWYISDFVWNSWEKLRSTSSGKLPIVSNMPKQNEDFETRCGFIFASRWIENKGLIQLLEAYGKANIEKSKWPLFILGDGPLREYVTSVVDSDKGVGIYIKGFVSEQLRNKLISGSKWMVTPPCTNEDLGLTVIEARNVKVPSIITRDGGLTEAAGLYALKCSINDIENLSFLIEIVAHMSDEEYTYLSEATWLEYAALHKDLKIYLSTYSSIVNGRR